MMKTFSSGVDGARIFLRIARRSGLVRALGLAGATELARAVVGGSLNASVVYRIYAKRTPNAPAIIWRNRTTTWADLDRRIDRFAAGLQRRGIGRGDSIVLLMSNRPELVELAAAAARCGARTATVVAGTTPRELAQAATTSGARALAIEASLLRAFVAATAELPAELLANVFVVGGDAVPGTTALDELLREERYVRPRDDLSSPAIVGYTSGTTGARKGAVRKLRKGTVRATLRFFAELPMRAGDVFLVAGPLARVSTYAFASYSHVLGCTLVLTDDYGPEELLRLIDRHRVTTAVVTPTTLPSLLALPDAVSRKYDTRSLRALFDANTALTARMTADFMARHGDVLVTLFGSTETGFITFAKPDDLRASPATIGRPLPGSVVRIVDAHDRDVEIGVVGELLVESAFIAEHVDTAEGRRSNHGAFRTGDLARRDAAGRYFFEGRKRDVVVVAGQPVYPMQVQAILEDHPGVREAAVVGVPDAESGQRVRAFIAARDGAVVDERDIRAFAGTRLRGPMLPRDFVFVDRIPRNPAGKVLKHELREQPVTLEDTP